ncbi:DNA-binding transcriptional regulator, MocR family, contains an aminotransferase domain [Monaibacterium marinum]|uniref:DNA-binding transcriptional regulator, MocR family, contains an aminotransferase domain n=1 Tax=Pontivivens marinum TaxID=1690039 RepID=A0A2C9CRD2_9RHOB|nr:PLP-dependent aminotransferase family protein [Monaibacterium marinum]SOH93904.1 DNA-binding transcriptional regulator, MocR family, contains an aminotransferase domain [Monaibacterium marinum]
MQSIDPEILAAQLSDRTTRGIARDTAALVRNGVLPVGARLPSLRALAFAMQVSPSTLSEAWKELRRLRVLTGRGRNGTYVSASTFAKRPPRTSAVGYFGPDALNLTMATPDISLLPRLDKALLHATGTEGLNSYARVRILPELEQALRPLWPCDAQAMLATNGGYNAVYITLQALVPQGASVALQMPAPLRLLDILEDLGMEILPLHSDEQGPTLDSMKDVLKSRPTAILLQPNISSVTGYYLCPERMQDLGDLLEQTDTLIIEDDGLGAVSGRQALSLGDRFPARTIHIRSFSKSFGPDLRMGVLSGAEDLVEQIQSYRAFSAGWTSRLLQAAVAWLLQDAETTTSVLQTAECYKLRRNRLAAALRQRGVDVADGSGLCLFAPVHSETFALITLAAHGIAVVPGASFSTEPTGHIRIGTSNLCEDKCHWLADIVALAAAEPFGAAAT